MILGHYREGDTVVHRMGAGVKLAMVLVLTTCVMLPFPLIVLPLGALLVIVGYWAAGFGPHLMWNVIKPLLFLVVVFSLLGWWGQGWEYGVIVAFRIVIAIFIATLLTLTTRIDDLMQAVVTALRPLRPLGVKPETVGLAFGLTMAAVPAFMTHVRTVREAQMVRGNSAHLTSFLTPLALQTIRHADLLGEALVARGYEDDGDEDDRVTAPRTDPHRDPRDP